MLSLHPTGNSYTPYAFPSLHTSSRRPDDDGDAAFLQFIWAQNHESQRRSKMDTTRIVAALETVSRFSKNRCIEAYCPTLTRQAARNFEDGEIVSKDCRVC
jgi:hypothetical protein